MWLSTHDSNQLVVKEVEIDAPVEEVWEKVATEEGREAWLEPDERDVLVESEDAPHRVTWWDGDGAHVTIELVPAVSGTRVIVTETAPVGIPLTALAQCFTAVYA